MRKLCGLLMAGVSALTVFSANADQVTLKNGDKLTGTVKSVEGGKMTFDSALLSTVTIKMDDISTFTTEKPIDIVVKKGESEQKVSVTAFGSEAGKIAAADGTVYSFADIAKINPPPVKWTGNVSAGATVARGNTHSETATAMFDASRRTDKDRTSAYGGYYFARERDSTTHRDDTSADNWFLKGQYDYFLSQKSYLYGSLKYEKDRIAHLDKRFTPGVGYGYQWIERADLNFNTEFGGSWIYEKYNDPTETRKYMALRAAYHVDKTISDKVKVYHNLEYIPSLEYIDNMLINADAGLQASITARLALDFKAILAYNSNPASDMDKLDTRYITALTWKF
ncbi:MAG: DUF481 domain-containing protein [Kiritimatiellae bacterium]|nr:DUF481 domain-containing protein [Kiritimatiellia bacterium]